MQIHEFQEMMRQLYFERDFERGINGTFKWLVDEVEELGEELRKGTDREATEKGVRRCNCLACFSRKHNWN